MANQPTDLKFVVTNTLIVARSGADQKLNLEPYLLDFCLIDVEASSKRRRRGGSRT
jgi:hypothetical protein